ncbi:MAG: 4-phosphoerythronate dehydrogenase [Gammaproteobacteria bacterium]
MRLFVDREIRGAPDVFERFGDVTLFNGRTLARAELAYADILLVRSVTRVDAALLDGTPVRMVGTATAGTDHLDLEYLRRCGIKAFDAAGCNARAVAEYVLACCLLASELQRRPPASLRIGVIGYGNVGKQVAALFTALGMTCVINDPPLAAAGSDAVFATLEAALACDIVTLHVPLTDDGEHPTRGMLAAAELATIGDDALLINAARGGVVDEHALLAWTQQRDRAIALDCWVNEPSVEPELLRRVTVATPHIAGHTIEARERAASILADTLAGCVGGTAAPITGQSEPAIIECAGPGAEQLATVRTAVLTCCDPRVPTRRLRATIALDAAGRAGAFDQLRRDAAGRREFGHYRIATAGLQSDTVACLRALGFHTN